MAEMNGFDRQMAAAAFAEANEPGAAREILQGERQGSSRMGKSPAGASKPYGKMVVFGAVSLALYLVLFNNEKLVTEVFTMGGWHTVFPVGTALVFSFIHGAFASNLLSVLGLEAKKK